jgi:hypothetical protein
MTLIVRQGRAKEVKYNFQGKKNLAWQRYTDDSIK